SPVRNKTEVAIRDEVLAQVLCHNSVVGIHEMHELGITPAFSLLETEARTIRFPGASPNSRPPAADHRTIARPTSPPETASPLRPPQQPLGPRSDGRGPSAASSARPGSQGSVRTGWTGQRRSRSAPPRWSRRPPTSVRPTARHGGSSAPPPPT